jgi:His/Glu/Gln/Arg/opine family amino acid ABC transporter permease subunit
MISDLAGFFATYEENWPSWWPQLLPAILVTIELTIASFLLAVVIGFLLALGKLSRNPMLRAFASGYVELARGIPALAILFLIYFGLVPLGIVLDAFLAGVVGLGMSSGGYFAEVFRAGILAVHKGQREAAASVGMTPYTSFRWIVLPQAMRVILPPMVNMFVSLLKDTSLCSLISAPELMLRAKDLAMMSFLPMHLFLLAAVVYFLLAWPMSLLARVFERRMSRGYRAG